MITTPLNWSSDISQAPRGENVTTPYQTMVKGEAKELTRTEFVPTKILALTRCGKVIQTHWIPEARAQGGAIMRYGHWSGFPEKPEYGGGPLLWAPWPDPDALQVALSATDVLDHAEVDA